MSEAKTASVNPGIARELTAFQQTILTILAEEPRYGLAIKRQLETYYDTEVNHGRLYPNLDELVDRGLIEKSELDKRTNEYGLTAAGVDAIFDQLSWTLSKLATDTDRTDRIKTLLNQHQ